MSKPKLFISLKNKLFLIMALALIIAALVFLGCREFGNFLVWRYYLNEENSRERVESYIEDFQEYVVDHKLSINDSEKITAWSSGRYVDIVLYKDKDLIYTPEWFRDFDESDESNSTSETQNEVDTELETEGNSGETADSSETTDESASMESLPNEGWFSGDRSFEQYLTQEAREQYQSVLNSLLDENSQLSPIYFVDGTLLINVVDYSENLVSSLVNIASLVAAFFVLAVIMIINFAGAARRVNKLAHKVNLVERGNLEMPIALEGNDEITLLADDVNSMRNAIVDNMTKEKQAWEANAELITAMSHDIRTPLTVLLGYLDLLELQNKDTESTEYIDACRENAMRLKHLSDDMFSYFLVFGKNGAELNISEYENGECIEHMIAEHSLLLSEKGYEIKRNGRIPDAVYHIDTAYFGRVIDNVFSNLMKYADPTAPVSIDAKIHEETLELIFQNKIKSAGDRPESNRIGLKTCVRIMEQMGGALHVSSCEDAFAVQLRLPALKPQKNATDSH